MVETNLEKKNYQTLEKIKGLSAVYWSDLTAGLFISKNDIMLYENEMALMQAILNIIYTNKGERVMLFDFGIDLDKYVFEGEDKKNELELVIEATLKRWEPRVNVLDVELIDINIPDKVVINISYIAGDNYEDIKKVSILYGG